MYSEKSCQMKDYAWATIMQSAKLCRGAQLGKMQNYVKCESVIVGKSASDSNSQHLFN